MSYYRKCRYGDCNLDAGEKPSVMAKRKPPRLQPRRKSRGPYQIKYVLIVAQKEKEIKYE